MAAVAPNSNDILGNARFTTASSASSPNRYDDIPTASSILSASIDPAALHPLAGLVDNKDLDYLLLDDDKISGVEGGKSVLPSRGWGDELCYGTGSTYLAGASSSPSSLAASSRPAGSAGLAAGGLWGFREGLRKPLAPRAPSSALSTTVPPAAAAASPSAPLGTAPLSSAVGSQAKAFVNAAKDAATEGAAGAADKARVNAQAAAKVSSRLRWNNVLNQVTRRGSFTGNSAGVLGAFFATCFGRGKADGRFRAALIYNGFNSTLDAYRGGKHDIYGSMAAGACTGALWKCTGASSFPGSPPAFGIVWRMRGGNELSDGQIILLRTKEEEGLSGAGRGGRWTRVSVPRYL